MAWSLEKNVRKKNFWKMELIVVEGRRHRGIHTRNWINRVKIDKKRSEMADGGRLWRNLIGWISLVAGA